MGYRFSKFVTIIKKDGLGNAIKKVYLYIRAKYLSRVNFLGFLKIKLNNKKIRKDIDALLEKDYDRIILWRSSFGWNVPLFQRPQHIARFLSQKKCLIFYEITTVTDKVRTYKKIEDNLILVNFNNRAMQRLLLEEIRKYDKPKYIQFYSTDATLSVKDLDNFVDDGYKIIYEYIDDINPKLLGMNELPANITEKYERMMEDTENTFVVVTADALEKDVLDRRGKEKIVFACNGVDYDHFAKLDKEIKLDNKFLKIIDENKPIVGYYGALANWFDYEMVKKLAKERPDYNIVLLGIKYDGSFDEANLEEYPNIYFLGPKKYDELPYYASKFSICTIPFLVNDITQATSPLKLFEYMALGKPIVTTAMKECKKYKSVNIINNSEEFIKTCDKLIEISKEKENKYFKLLKSDAMDNTWESKSKLIVNLLREYENK